MQVAATTRDRLLEAATEVFAEQGYDGTRVQDVARRAGLTTGAIYSRFRDKADLLLEAIAQSSEDEMSGLVEAASASHADELLAALGQSLISGRPSSGDYLLLEALVAARRDPSVAEMVKANLAQQSRAVAALFVHGKKDGAIASDVSTEAAVSFCMALAVGLLVFRCLDVPMPPDKKWSALIRRLVDSLGGGMGEEQPRPPLTRTGRDVPGGRLAAVPHSKGGGMGEEQPRPPLTRTGRDVSGGRLAAVPHSEGDQE